MLEYDTLFIGNRWVTPASESVLEVRSPATLALVGRSPDGSPDDMDHARSLPHGTPSTPVPGPRCRSRNAPRTSTGSWTRSVPR